MGGACGGETVSPEVYKIQYFKDVHGRAEPLRLLLHYSGTPFVESGVSMAGWMVRKGSGNTGEFGQLPIVSYQGRDMQQFGAVLRSVGVEKGYYNPRDFRESMRIDWIVDTWGGLLVDHGALAFKIASTATMNVAWQELVTTKWRKFLTALENQLQTQNSRFIAGDRVTIADFVMYSIVHVIF